MNTDINFKEMWNSRQAPLSDAQEILSKANAWKRKAFAGLIVTNILLLATCVFIGAIWYQYQPKSITTKIGIVLTILAMLLYLLIYNQNIPLLLKKGYERNNQQFLQELLQLKKRHAFLQTTMLNTYFILLGLGIALYMIEYVQKMPLWAGILAYVLTALWIAFVWFYIKPKVIKKQRSKLNGLIDKLREISNQQL